MCTNSKGTIFKNVSPLFITYRINFHKKIINFKFIYLCNYVRRSKYKNLRVRKENYFTVKDNIFKPFWSFNMYKAPDYNHQI